MPVLNDEILTAIFLEISKNNDIPTFNKSLCNFMIASSETCRLVFNIFSSVENVTLKNDLILINTNGYYGNHTFTIARDSVMLNPLIKLVQKNTRSLTVDVGVSCSSIDQWRNCDLDYIKFDSQISMKLIKPYIFRKSFTMVAVTNCYQEYNVFRNIMNMNSNRFTLSIKFETFLKSQSKRFCGHHINQIFLNGRFDIGGFKKRLNHTQNTFNWHVCIASKIEKFLKILEKNFANVEKIIANFHSIHQHGFSWLQIYKDLQLLKIENFKLSGLQGMLVFNTNVKKGFEEAVHLTRNDPSCSSTCNPKSIKMVFEVTPDLSLTFVSKFLNS